MSVLFHLRGKLIDCRPQAGTDQRRRSNAEDRIKKHWSTAWSDFFRQITQCPQIAAVAPALCV